MEEVYKVEIEKLREQLSIEQANKNEYEHKIQEQAQTIARLDYELKEALREITLLNQEIEQLHDKYLSDSEDEEEGGEEDEDGSKRSKKNKSKDKSASKQLKGDALFKDAIRTVLRKHFSNFKFFEEWVFPELVDQVRAQIGMNRPVTDKAIRAGVISLSSRIRWDNTELVKKHVRRELNIGDKEPETASERETWKKMIQQKTVNWEELIENAAEKMRDSTKRTPSDLAFVEMILHYFFEGIQLKHLSRKGVDAPFTTYQKFLSIRKESPGGGTDDEVSQGFKRKAEEEIANNSNTEVVDNGMKRLRESAAELQDLHPESQQ